MSIQPGSEFRSKGRNAGSVVVGVEERRVEVERRD
jgi:hypothetical protein